jgi:hypothetical protein
MLALGAAGVLAGLSVLSGRGSRSAPDLELPEVVPSSMRRRLALALRHGGRLARFRDEPAAYRSFRSYVEEIQDFVEVPDAWVLVGELPTEVAKAEVLASLGVDFEDFDSYHRWYAQRSEIPDYPRESRWPSQLDLDDGSEFLWDGWHRFHSYVRSGHDTVPYYAHVEDHVAHALLGAGLGR